MKCKECKKFMTMGNTDETGMGVCSFPNSYFPVNTNDECVYTLNPYTCGDCDRLGNDFACFTCRAEDSAYHNGGLCGGFIDKQEVAIESAITEWIRRGIDVHSKITSILESIDIDKLPTEENLRKDRISI